MVPVASKSFGGLTHSSYLSTPASPLLSHPTIMNCWSSRSEFKLTVCYVALTGHLEVGATAWLLFLNTKSETFFYDKSRTCCSNCAAYQHSLTHVQTIPAPSECCVAEFASNGFSSSKHLTILVVSSLPSCCLCLGRLSQNNWYEHRKCFIDSSKYTMDIQNEPQYYPPDYHLLCSTHSQEWYQYLHPHPWHCHLDQYQVSWSASWPSTVSTCRKIPRILAAMVVLRSSSSSRWLITAPP